MTDRKYPDLWVDPEDDPRRIAFTDTDERSTYAGYLHHYRLTLELKCDGLTADQLARRSVDPSTLSLLGLVRHMAEVERSWFRRRLAQQVDAPRLWGPRGVDADFDGAVADAEVVASAWSAWRTEVAFAQEWLAANDDMSAVVRDREHGDLVVRDVLVHLIEEYARHCGHADLLRERIDGRTGQ